MPGQACPGPRLRPSVPEGHPSHLQMPTFSLWNWMIRWSSFAMLAGRVAPTLRGSGRLPVGP
eukprot:5440096-Pyramimonas_sp.AAC.1